MPRSDSADIYSGELKELKPTLFKVTGVNKRQVVIRICIIYLLLFAGCFFLYGFMWGFCHRQLVNVLKVISLAGNLLSIYILFISHLLDKHDTISYVDRKFARARKIEHYKQYSPKKQKELLASIHDNVLKEILFIFQVKVGTLILAVSTTIAFLAGMLQAPG